MLDLVGLIRDRVLGRPRPPVPRFRVRSCPGGWVFSLEYRRAGAPSLTITHRINAREFEDNVGVHGPLTMEALVVESLARMTRVHGGIICGDSSIGADGKPVDASPGPAPAGLKVPRPRGP